MFYLLSFLADRWRGVGAEPLRLSFPKNTGATAGPCASGRAYDRSGPETQVNRASGPVYKAMKSQRCRSRNAIFSFHA